MPDHRAHVDFVVASDLRVPCQISIRPNPRPRADLHVLLDHHIRSHIDGRIEFRFRADDRCRMNRHAADYTQTALCAVLPARAWPKATVQARARGGRGSRRAAPGHCVRSNRDLQASWSMQSKFSQRGAGSGEILRFHLHVIAREHHSLGARLENREHFLFDALRCAMARACAHGHIDIDAVARPAWTSRRRLPACAGFPAKRSRP